MRLAKEETRRGLAIATWEASAASVHNTLTGNAFLTGFALAWGARDFHLGLLGAIPYLGAVFQLAGAYWADRWPEHRRLSVAIFGILSRGSWFFIAATPFFVGGPPARIMAWILALYLFYQATLHASAPGWMAWMGVLIPPRLRGRYLGRRSLMMESFGVVAVLLAGVAMDAFRAAGWERPGFALLQVCAGVAGCICFLLILRQPDPGHVAPPPSLKMSYLLRPLKDLRFRRFVVFNLYWQIGNMIALPFFNAHLLKNMAWSFKALAVLGLLISAASILMNPVWGRWMDRVGSKRVLAVSCLGLLTVPLLYAGCPWMLRWPIYLANVLNGVFLCGFNLAIVSLTLSEVSPEARAIGPAVLAALAGPVVFITGAMSGWAADALASVHWQVGCWTVGHYAVLFAVSVVLRVPAFVLLSRIHAQGVRK